MHASFFAQFVITGVSVAEIRERYLHWSLGTGLFGKLRRNRLELGIPSHLTVGALQVSGDYLGDNDCSLAVRRDEHVAVLRMSHRDGENGAVFWHNVVRLTALDNGTRVEHVVARSAPRGVRLPPRASSPSVVGDVIAEYRSRGVVPRDLYTANVALTDADGAARFTRHVLLDRDRGVPVLVVTTPARADRALVSPVRLTKQLRGMVMVAELTTRDTTEALTAELLQAGFEKQFTCFDGGVRLYMPGLSPSNGLYQHPLWIRTWLLDLDMDPVRRTDVLAGIVAERIVETTMPADLLHAVQEFDRSERRRHAAQVLAAPPPDPAASMDSLLAAATEQNTALDKALRELTDEIAIYDDSNRALAEQLAEQKNMVAQLESQAQLERLKAEALKQQLDAKLDQREGVVLPPEVRADIAAAMAGKLTPELVLRLLPLTWPDRVVVLDSALRSSKESESFKYVDKARDMLTRLVTSYYDALTQGGDNEARKVFGKNEFAATENDLPREGLRRRTFNYRGRQIEMLTHLKIGVKDSAAETMRIHFYWDAAEKKIVIGHCGPHINFN